MTSCWIMSVTDFDLQLSHVYHVFPWMCISTQGKHSSKEWIILEPYFGCSV